MTDDAARKAMDELVAHGRAAGEEMVAALEKQVASLAEVYGDTLNDSNAPLYSTLSALHMFCGLVGQRDESIQFLDTSLRGVRAAALSFAGYPVEWALAAQQQSALADEEPSAGAELGFGELLNFNTATQTDEMLAICGRFYGVPERHRATVATLVKDVMVFSIGREMPLYWSGAYRYVVGAIVAACGHSTMVQ